MNSNTHDHQQNDTADLPEMDATTAEAKAPQPQQRRSRPRLMLLATSLAALVLVGALGGVAAFWDDAEPEGLVFVIPAGAAQRLDMPTIDSAIDIPVDIRFGPNDVKRITIINEDSTMNRAGPWLVDAGQRYTLKFDNPGVYQFDCTVDASESVTVTVTE